MHVVLRHGSLPVDFRTTLELWALFGQPYLRCLILKATKRTTTLSRYYACWYVASWFPDRARVCMCWPRRPRACGYQQTLDAVISSVSGAGRLMSVPPSVQLNSRFCGISLVKSRDSRDKSVVRRHQASGDLFPTKDARGLSLGAARQAKAKPRSIPRCSGML
jgi:hypothetical protein